MTKDVKASYVLFLNFPPPPAVMHGAGFIISTGFAAKCQKQKPKLNPGHIEMTFSNNRNGASIPAVMRYFLPTL